MTRIAVMLPGQGSQVVGMGREMADAVPELRKLYEMADEVLGMPLSRVCWEGPEEELTATQNAQPALLLHSYAVWTQLPESVRSGVVIGAGHSLGEFSAHLIAGTFGLEDALRLVRARGELMAGAGDERPGTMAAILGLEPAGVEEALSRVSSGSVVAANFNAPGQIVISGDIEAVAEAGRQATDLGARKVVQLNVSAAFHSPLMQGAEPGLAEALDGATWSDAAFPVVANATAEAVRAAGSAREALLRQLTSPVRWVEGVERMRDAEPDLWLELGPGRVLAGLLKRIDREQTAVSVGDLDAIAALAA